MFRLPRAAILFYRLENPVECKMQGLQQKTERHHTTKSLSAGLNTSAKPVKSLSKLVKMDSRSITFFFFKKKTLYKLKLTKFFFFTPGTIFSYYT